MEYVSGEDLKSMIAMSGQLGVGTAISIAKQVCDGLSEAHRLGVIHRDLKPQNIQIDKGGHAKIMDFGIARSVRGKGLTDAGIAIGTSQYMAPEQAEARGVDARSDLYALGVILYEMLTGRVPFDGDTPLAVAMKHKLEAPRDPRELNASIPADFAGVILRCLEKDPAKRYQSAAEVHAELVRIEQGLPTTAQVVPQTRPSTSKEITVHFTMRQLRVPALVLAALVVVGLGAWRLWPRSSVVGSPGAAAGKPTLAVLYCENNSGDAALNTWRTGLPELLITSLSQSRLLNVVSSENLFTILTRLKLADAKRFSTDDLAAVARDASAQYLLTCSVMKAGQSTVLTARLQTAATGETIGSPKRIELKDGDILARVDELANGLKADLDLSPQAIAGDSGQPLDQVLTSSPEALKYYTEARKLHWAVKYGDALALYQAAINADPGFAMAYRGMSSCAGNLGDRVKQAAAGRKALELSDRLPERFKYQIQITAYYSSTATYPQVIDASKKLLEMYPDDTIALSYLSLVYCLAEDAERCVELREKAARLAPSYLSASNLASVYAALGRYDDARSTYDHYLEHDPQSGRAHGALGNLYLIRGQLAEALRESDRTMLLDPRGTYGVLLKGNVALLQGDYAAAEREYLSIADQATPTGAGSPKGSAATSRLRAGLLYLTQGRFEKALEQIQASTIQGTSNGWLGWAELEAGRPDLAVKTFQRRLADPAVASEPIAVLDCLDGVGRSFAAMGDVGKVRKTLDDVKAFDAGVFLERKNRTSLTLSGVLAATRRDGPAAVADLERAFAMLPYQAGVTDEHAALLDLLAQAYTVAGDLTKARQTYEKITALTTGRLAWGATWARSFYHLGLIAEKQGDRARAREQFGKFLEIWKDADKGLPEIADAKKRMGQ